MGSKLSHFTKEKTHFQSNFNFCCSIFNVVEQRHLAFHKKADSKRLKLYKKLGYLRVNEILTRTQYSLLFSAKQKDQV